MSEEPTLDVTTIWKGSRQRELNERHRCNTLAGETPCLLCGRGVKQGHSGVEVHLCHGGLTIRPPFENYPCDDEGGCIGYLPIGPYCYKRHKKVLEPFVLRD